MDETTKAAPFGRVSLPFPLTEEVITPRLRALLSAQPINPLRENQEQFGITQPTVPKENE